MNGDTFNLKVYDVPPGVPAALKLSVAARVLGFEERTVRHRADEGALEVIQVSAGRRRYVPAAEVARLAALYGLEPRWLEAI